MTEPSDLGLLKELDALHREFGRTPTRALMAGHGTYSPTTFENRFGSWDAALTAAGIDPAGLTDKRYHTLKHLDEELAKQVIDCLLSNETEKFYRGKLLAELNRLAIELDKTPSGPDMVNYGRQNPSSYTNYFGSWNASVEWLGLTSNDNKHQISDEELIEELRRLAEDTGARPLIVDMRDEGEYSYPTYIVRFGSWEAACDAAELEVI